MHCSVGSYLLSWLNAWSDCWYERCLFASLRMIILLIETGGYLSEPAKEFAIFNTPFWREHAYLFPCLVSGNL